MIYPSPGKINLIRNGRSFIISKMKYIIGMDVGTTATKGVLYDINGKAVASVSKGYPLIQTKVGRRRSKINF